MENQKVIPLGQLFKKSFENYSDKFKILTKISALSFLVWIISIPFIGVFIALNFKFLFEYGALNLVRILIGGAFLLIGVLLAIILEIWIFSTLFYALKQGDNNTKLKEVMSQGWQNLASFFWVGFLRGVIVLLGFICFIVPGIVFSIWFSFAPYVFIFEGKKGFEALKRSKELVKGKWWPIFWRIVIVMVISGLISSIRFFGPIVNLLFTTPFIIVFFNNLYEDLKK